MNPVRATIGAVSAGLLLTVGIVAVRNLLPAGAPGCGAATSVVRGIVGSEKEAFLRDPRVTEIFRCAGLELRIDPSGSRDMVGALKSDRGRYDFAFPASAPTALKITSMLGVNQTFRPFSSVMVVATFTDIAAVLRANHVVEKVDGTEVILVDKLIDLARKEIRWRQLAGNEGSPNRNVVLMRTTDPADSNSAIMFLSILSAVLNDDRSIAGADELPRVMPDLCRLMAYQGDKPPTSGLLFSEYVTDGPSRTPMALIYESQFLDRESPEQVPQDGRHVMFFPKPTAYAWHTLVPLSEAGSTVGRMLRDNAELKDIAARYGFRPEGRTLTDRPNPPVVVEPPDYPVLEAMLGQLGGFNRQTGKCAK
jgi:hypothetical protein